MSSRPGISVIVPVKDTRWAKTRLGLENEPRQLIARQLALSTIRAVLASPSVGQTLVVTSTHARCECAPVHSALAGLRIDPDDGEDFAQLTTGMTVALVPSSQPGSGRRRAEVAG